MKNPSHRLLLRTFVALAVTSALLGHSRARGAEENRDGVIELSDVAAGKGGFVIHGTDEPERWVFTINGTGDINGDGLDDLEVSELFLDETKPSNSDVLQKTYVVFGKKDSAPVKLSDIANGAGGFLINVIDDSDDWGLRNLPAGDVNGDGIDDRIIRTARVSYVVFFKADGTAADLSSIENGIGGFIIQAGEGVLNSDDDSDSDVYVASAGDINGDGLGDLVAQVWGERLWEFRPPEKRYVIFGKTSGTPVTLSHIATDNSPDGYVISEIGDVALRERRHLEGAGDVNGDGLNDFFIGIQNIYDNPVADKTYVVFGKSSGTALKISALAEDDNDSGFVIRGDGIPRFSSDVNGDGLDDIIMVHNWHQWGTTTEFDGESYVVFGKESGTAVELSEIVKDDNAGGFRIDQSSLQHHGRSTTDAGDVNGDGLDDLIVEDPEYPFEGNKVVFGKATGTSVDLEQIAKDDNAGGFRISPRPAEHQRMFAAGDANGDGLADIIVDTRIHDYKRDVRTGESYIVFGKASGEAVNLPDIAAGSGGFSIGIRDIGREHDGSWYRRGIYSAGDVNGDGRDDIIVNDTDPGTAYVVFSPVVSPKPSEGGK